MRMAYLYSEPVWDDAIMNKITNFYKDIVIGILYISGVFGFMSGEFIVSSVIFGSASLISNFYFRETV